MKNISDIINSKYLETELPELLITESGIIKDISKIILESVKDNLKKSFKDKQITELISKLSEDQELIENLLVISEQLLNHIDNEYGSYQLKEKEYKISDIWKFK